MTAIASFISPLAITSAMVTSSTAVTRLATELDWNAATNYTVGTVVFRPAIGRRFESRVGGVNSSPPEDALDRWYDLGATDKMAMFDGQVGTQSIASGTLTAVFRPGAFNAIYLAGLDGLTLSITVKDKPGGTPIYEHTEPLEDSAPADYYEYFFSPFRPKTEFLATGLTPYAKCEVTITITNPGGVARCGIVSLGDQVSMLAEVESGAKVKVRNFSKIEADPKGVTTIEKGRKARDVSGTITVPLGAASDLADALDAILDTPCLLILAEAGHLRFLRNFGLLNYDVTARSIDAVFNLSQQGTI